LEKIGADLKSDLDAMRYSVQKVVLKQKVTLGVMLQNLSEFQIHLFSRLPSSPCQHGASDISVLE
jgi:hypothetical protein